MTQNDNPFIQCIRTRKQYGLPLKNCLGVDCENDCPASMLCPYAQDCHENNDMPVRVN